MKSTIKNLLLGTMIIVLAASCNFNDQPPLGNAKLNVYLVDAPATFDEVWVEVLAVNILMKGESEENEAAWININQQSENQKINLLTLVGNNESFLGQAEIPAGEISHIRLVLGGDNYFVVDGMKTELKTPSAQQSGLKLKVDKQLLPDTEYDLTLDFDAGKSIVKAGNSGQFNLKPVIRVIAEESASIQGIILPLDANPMVLGITGSDTVSTFTDENGYFKLRGLKGGNYIVVMNPKSKYERLVISPVVTEMTKTKTLDPVILQNSN